MSPISVRKTYHLVVNQLKLPGFYTAVYRPLWVLHNANRLAYTATLPLLDERSLCDFKIYMFCLLKR